MELSWRHMRAHSTDGGERAALAAQIFCASYGDRKTKNGRALLQRRKTCTGNMKLDSYEGTSYPLFVTPPDTLRQKKEARLASQQSHGAFDCSLLIASQVLSPLN